MYTLAAEKDVDYWEVEALFDLCFAPGREALSSYRLRDGVKQMSKLSLVARDDNGILGGAIRYWPVQVSGALVLLLGPIAVHPTRAGEGLGGVLIRDSLEIAKSSHENGGPTYHRVMLVGDAPYYGRFGFHRLTGVMMPPPTNPDRVLGLDLEQGGWNNITGHVRRIGETKNGARKS